MTLLQIWSDSWVFIQYIFYILGEVVAGIFAPINYFVVFVFESFKAIFVSPIDPEILPDFETFNEVVGSIPIFQTILFISGGLISLLILISIFKTLQQI